MESNLILTNENPIRRSNFFSKLCFCWFMRFCSKYPRYNIRLIDLYAVLLNDKSGLLTDKLEKNWKREISEAGVKSRNPSLYKAISKTFFWIYMYYGVFLFIGIAVLKPIQPVLMAIIIQIFTTHSWETHFKEKCIYGGLLIFDNLISIFFIYHSYLILNRIGMRVRVACSSLVYRKILRLSPKALQESASGKIINLLSNDVIRFDSVAMYLHHIWITPILVIIGCVFIWYQIGIPGIIALLGSSLVIFPLNVIVGKYMGKFRLQVAEKSDQRINKMAEIISGIQIIKMYAWEKPFAEIVNKIRIDEIDRLSVVSYARALLNSSWDYLSKTSLFITVVIHVLMGHRITAAQVFSLAQIFSILQTSIAQFPYAISTGAETLTSIERLRKFLLLEEKFEPVIANDFSNDGEVALKKVTASWVPGNPILTNISVHIPKGSLCAIVGEVGVGKSSLLQLLLGELVQEKGTITVGGEVSYSSQSAWIFSTSVRKNVLFGQIYDRDRYRNVVKVCSLKKDFEQFPHGDESLVGEKGVTLSGGQKARINLARAVYRDADIYLLDDPLSAVDTNVGKELFQHCIKGYLGKKTRILVTHQLQYMKEVDHIVVLNEGRIEAQGTFRELSNSNIDFTKLLVKEYEESNPAIKHDKEVSEKLENSIDSSSTKSDASTSLSTKKDVENEEEISKPDSSIYWTYMKSGGGLSSLTLFAIWLIVGQIFNNSCDLWVTYWTSHTTLWYTLESRFTASYISHLAIYIYSAIIACFIILSIVTSLHFYRICLNSSKTLHNRMFSSLLEVPMRFFETNPSGRIINRFSRDIGIIDEVLPTLTIGAIQVVLIGIGSLLIIIYTNPYIMIVIIILIFFLNKLRNTFITVSRYVTHLEGIGKSPVFTHINATWNGITTIRAMKMESQLQNEFDMHQDTHTSAWYLSLVLMTAFQVWTDLISLSFVAFVVAGFILLDHFIVIDSSLVGLALYQSFFLMEVIQFGITQATHAVNQFTCVERVLDYTKLDKEESSDEALCETLWFWPCKGSIKFVDVSLRYSLNNPCVLKGLKFSIEPGEKIGIVGRTGAGKSSLLSALFLLTPIEGNIVIDGIDTKRVALKQLRSAISVIPQEPVLFSASLRYNLDPFDKYLDSQIWKALEDVELKNVAPSLDFVVQEGGCNFSVGQRQLMCMARAILRKNKILVLDEATANVDSKTDELIQKTIRNKFAGYTVLTVAHRLNTIMDSDRVMVLNDGLIVEFDHAHKLLENENGWFSKLVVETDSVHLKAVAENHYKSKIANVK